MRRWRAVEQGRGLALLAVAQDRVRRGDGLGRLRVVLQRDEAVVVYYGDGASSQGDVHEAMVFANTYRTPQVFFLQNNQWAISVPFSTQSRVPLATRAAGYGFEGVRVDGNDVLAVYAVTRDAVRRARAGEGPYILEVKTYRYRGHSMSDPAKYRTRDEVNEYRTKRDPIEHVREILMSQHGVTEDDLLHHDELGEDYRRMTEQQATGDEA